MLHNRLAGLWFAATGSAAIRNCSVLRNAGTGLHFADSSQMNTILSDSVIMGPESDASGGDTNISGLTFGPSAHLTVSNVTFSNFSCTNCAAIRPGSNLRLDVSNVSIITEKLTFHNTSHFRIYFGYEHQVMITDIDGSLGGTDSGSSILPASSLLPVLQCHNVSNISCGVPGVSCLPQVSIRNFQWKALAPSEILDKPVAISNIMGSSLMPGRKAWAPQRTAKLYNTLLQQTYFTRSAGLQWNMRICVISQGLSSD